MTKTSTRTAAQIKSDVSADGSKEQKSRTKAEQQLVDQTEQSNIDANAVTAESITTNIVAGIASLAAAFSDFEVRHLADNGKAYPMDATAPEGVTISDQEVMVNRLAYLQKQLTSVVCWKLETMLEQQTDRIVEQRKRIAQALRQIDTGRVEEAQVERMADFLEVLIEQRQMVDVAFTAALDVYAAETGEDFETKAMREERERELRNKPKSDLAARMARLGVG